jgi:hypothetical protein
VCVCVCVCVEVGTDLEMFEGLNLKFFYLNLIVTGLVLASSLPDGSYVILDK